MTDPEKYLGFPLEEAKRIASGEGEAFPDVIYTSPPVSGSALSRRHKDAVTRIIGYRDGHFIAARFNEFIVTEGTSAGDQSAP